MAQEQIAELAAEPAGGDLSEGGSADRERLRAIIGVLRSRAQGPSPRLTCLTDQHVACWQAVLKGHGAQAELAHELHVHPSRITQLKKAARAKVRETVYVAGVLGPEGALEDPTLMEACLDVYDSTAQSHVYLTPADRVRLSTAAEAVMPSRRLGQRVDPQRAANLFLKRKDKAKLRAQLAGADDATFETFMTEFAVELHEAETRQASCAHVDFPNCVLVCSTHNPVIDRVIWEVEMP